MVIVERVIKSACMQTVTKAARCLFNGGSLTVEERASLADWIFSHQNRQRGFVLHPTSEEITAGIRHLAVDPPPPPPPHRSSWRRCACWR